MAPRNRSKRGVVCDLETEDDRAQVQRLVAGADIMLHGFTPSQAA